VQKVGTYSTSISIPGAVGGVSACLTLERATVPTWGVSSVVLCFYREDVLLCGLSVHPGKEAQ
jgi:hypothetical protein